jgi:hypothetical protein
VISPSQRPLPDNTQHSQKTDSHALGGIRTHSSSKRAAVDRRLRPRGYWDRRTHLLLLTKYLSMTFCLSIRLHIKVTRNMVPCTRVWPHHQASVRSHTLPCFNLQTSCILKCNKLKSKRLIPNAFSVSASDAERLMISLTVCSVRILGTCFQDSSGGRN